MAQVTLYVIKCGFFTGNPDSVILASTDYTAVTARRDSIEQGRIDGENMCPGLHPIQHKVVTI